MRKEKHSMGRFVTPLKKRIKLRADWATGEYTYTNLSDKYDIGTKTVRRIIEAGYGNQENMDRKAEEAWKNFGFELQTTMTAKAMKALAEVDQKTFLRYFPSYQKFFKAHLKSMDIRTDGDVNIIMENTGEKLLSNEL